MSKFKVGDIVQVRTDLIEGMIYYNSNCVKGSTFTNGMKKSLGQEARIISIRNKGYTLNIGFHLYTDTMLRRFAVEDTDEESSYDFNIEVEGLVINVQLKQLENMIDIALDNRNEDLFIELVKEYNNKKIELDKIIYKMSLDKR